VLDIAWSLLDTAVGDGLAEEAAKKRVRFGRMLGPIERGEASEIRLILKRRARVVLYIGGYGEAHPS